MNVALPQTTEPNRNYFVRLEAGRTEHSVGFSERCAIIFFDSRTRPQTRFRRSFRNSVCKTSLVLFTDGGSVTSERSTFFGLGPTDNPDEKQRNLFGRGSHVTDAFKHQHRTLVGPQRFNSGSVCLSYPFERHRKLDHPVRTSCGLAKLLASVEHGCPCVSAPTGLFACTSLELQREGKEALRTGLQCLAFFRTFGVINLTSHS